MTGNERREGNMSKAAGLAPGEKFGKWTLLTLEPRGHRRFWSCRCDCGTERDVYESSLTSGRSTGCGCWKRGHMLTETPEYQAWRGAKLRCGNPNTPNYKNYGGRGIKMCERWIGDFLAFLADMGPRPSARHSLDRIDVNGDYEPGNCRWATWSVQSLNKRTNRRLEAFGRTQTITEWARETGLSCDTLRTRVAAGWSVERAVTTPWTPRALRRWAS